MDLLGILLQESDLSEKQLESLLSYLKVVSGELRYKDAAAQRSTKPVTIGSYYRTVQQARNNVRRSIVTLAIAIRIGLVKFEDARRLLDLVVQGAGELDEPRSDQFREVIRVLLDRVVM